MNCMQFNETDQQVKLEFKDVSYFSSGEGGNVSAAIAEHNSATDARTLTLTEVDTKLSSSELRT